MSQTQGIDGGYAAGPIRPSATEAEALVAAHTHGGRVDTTSLAAAVRDAHALDPSKAEAGYAAISAQLRTSDPVAAGRFDREVTQAFQSPPLAGISIAAGGAISEAGQGILRNNPILSVEWVSTTNLAGQSGFTPGLQALLDRNGIDVRPGATPTPPAVLSNAPADRTANGAAARDAIATDLRSQGYATRTEVEFQTRVRTPDYPSGVRRVDVVADATGPTPETRQRVLVESKLGRTSTDGFVRNEVAKDADLLAQNTRLRGAGRALDIGGRVLRPVGTVVDAVEIGQAVRTDGGRFGENAQRTTAGVAGGVAGGAGGAWAGAAAGAAVGSVVPIVGTAAGAVIGGLIGGFLGGWGGDAAGRAAYDAATQ